MDNEINLENIDEMVHNVSDSYFPLPLKDSIDLSKILDGVTFNVNTEDLYDDPEERFYTGTELLAHNKISDCLGLEDDDDEGTPFEKLMNKMENVIPNGLVKKVIKDEGIGGIIPEKALVTIHYNAYLEYQDDPYDSTYLNHRPMTFRLGSGKVLPGLDIAVASMKLNEISQFIIDPELGFGKQGCLGRIPKNSRLMFIVEVLKVVDSGAADEYEKYDLEDRKKFANVYKVALALRAKANDLVKNGSIKSAIKNYNIAVNMLEEAHLNDMNEQNDQQSLLMKLYINLAICYNKEDKPRKACIMCKQVYEITEDKMIKPTPKLFFNHGRALFKLGEYSKALKKLITAKNMLPDSLEITDEITKVETKLELHHQQELKFAKLCISTNNDNTSCKSVSGLSNEFIQNVQEFCNNIKEDPDPVQQYLPHGLNESEIECFKKEAENVGLVFQTCKRNDKTVYVIGKKIM